MEVTHFAFAQCTMNAALADPRVLYGDPDGHIAVLLSPLSEYGSVSLVGTADELHALADKLRAIVTAHESQTTLTGEAGEEIELGLDDNDHPDECNPLVGYHAFDHTCGLADRDADSAFELKGQRS